MSWNYRVVRSCDSDGSPWYDIREAYYKDANTTHPHSITANGVRAGGETLLSLRKDLALMLAAFDKAPLDARAFDGQPPAEPMSDPARLTPVDEGKASGSAS